MVPVSVSVWLVTATVWAVLSAVTVWAFFWALNHAVNEALTWWKIKRLFVEFLLRRNDCTCGAVGDKALRRERKPLPTVQEDYNDPRRPFD